MYNAHPISCINQTADCKEETWVCAPDTINPEHWVPGPTHTHRLKE